VDALSAILVCAIIYAIGDVVSNKTQSLMPMIFVSGFLLLVGFWTFLPASTLSDTGLFQLSVILAPMFVVHTGSMMSIEQLKREYKTVLIAIAAVAAIALLLYFAGSLLIGKQQAAAAVGPISGGLVAVLIIQEAASAIGLERIAIFVTLLFVLQLFIGLPIAALCLSRDARQELSRFRAGEVENKVSNEDEKQASAPRWRVFPETPKDLKTPFILLTKALIVAWLAVWVSGLMDGAINKFIVALAFGVLFKELGFIETRVLDEANSSGFVLFVLFILVYWYLPKASPALLVEMIYPIVVCFVSALIAISVVAVLAGKVTGYSWRLCMALGVSCMFGFPGTLIIPEEVAKSQGETKDEQDFLVQLYLPKMLIAGLTTVSIASVIIAGVMVGLL